MKKSTWISLGVVGVILLIIIFSSGQNSNSNNQATTQKIPSIPVSQVQIDNLKLGKQCCGLTGYQLTGKITNNSSLSFEGVDVTVEAYDCPDETISSACAHIGEDKNILLFVDGNTGGQFPPEQVREASGIVSGLSGMPPIQGNFLWSYTVTGFWNGFETIPATEF